MANRPTPTAANKVASDASVNSQSIAFLTHSEDGKGVEVWKISAHYKAVKRYYKVVRVDAGKGRPPAGQSR
jgi:hypothetical protein